MIDRLVRHTEVVAMKGDSYRLKDRDLGMVPPTTQRDHDPSEGGSIFTRRRRINIQPPLTGVHIVGRTAAPARIQQVRNGQLSALQNGPVSSATQAAATK
jgi:hypothetical protein